MPAPKRKPKTVRRRRPSSRQLKKRALYRRITSFTILGIVVILGALIIFRPTPEPEPEPDSTPTEIALAAERGRRLAAAALALPAGSMQREEAILDIRARETALRRSGFTLAADALAASADSLLTTQL